MDLQIWDSDLPEKRWSGTYPCHFVKSGCFSHQAAAENGCLDENHFQIALIHIWGEIQNNHCFHLCQLVAQNVDIWQRQNTV